VSKLKILPYRVCDALSIYLLAFGNHMMIVDCLAVAEREKQSKAFREQLVAQTDHLDHFVCFFILKKPFV
jgi:hypothetical protein